jgi:hypothetical protein
MSSRLGFCMSLFMNSSGVSRGLLSLFSHSGTHPAPGASRTGGSVVVDSPCSLSTVVAARAEPQEGCCEGGANANAAVAKRENDRATGAVANFIVKTNTTKV